MRTNRKTPSKRQQPGQGQASFNFLCFDTEDDSKELLAAGKSGFDKKVTQIAAITADGKHYYNKGDVPAFLKWLERQPERFLYAHNLQYDIGNLFADKLDVLDQTLVGGRVIKAVWGSKVFVDSFNIWPMSAKKLGEAFGLKKLETDSMAKDKAYVFRDVEIIRAAMLFAWQFCASLGLKHLPPTLGTLCVKVWKYFGGVNCHDSQVITREALFGGRVELFKVVNDAVWQTNSAKVVYSVFNNDLPPECDGFAIDELLNIPREKTVAYVDVNSLYPFAMQKDFPGPMQSTGRNLLDYGIARATVKVPETALPVLPFRRKDGKILYPWGRFTGCWTIAELREAQRQGAKIERVIESVGTNEAMQPYKIFVDRLYQTRLDSKSDAEKLFFKLLMNNLFGRLGTTGVIARSVWQNERNKFDGVPYGDKVLVNYQMPLAEETNWAHAAHVTSYGRLELLRYLQLIGPEDLIYCDTDSAIFDWQQNQPLPFSIGKHLGEMKLESWESCVIAFAPKMYRAGDTYKAKGVPKHKAREFIETGRAEFELPFKMREAMRFYDPRFNADGKQIKPANTRKLSVWRKVSKARATDYDRKKLIGNRFFPCKVSAV